jgi:hypothetical protein
MRETNTKNATQAECAFPFLSFPFLSFPFLSGRMEIWAAAIIHALGSINFLFDPSKKKAAKSEKVLGQVSGYRF